jgi:hypothetical protein
MNNKLLQTAAAAALAVSFAVPAMANPFSDVPKNHWAYGAVNALAREGVIEGYGDGTFKGEQSITRYEMAQLVAKAMGGDLNANQKATIEKLAREFADELHDLGREIDEVKEKQERIKITGDARIRYGAAEQGDSTDFRARVNVEGKVSDDVTFNTRISSGNISYDGKADDTEITAANLNANIFGIGTTIGRQDIKLGTGMIIDDTMNGVAADYKDLTVFVGNQTDEDERLYGAELKTRIFDGLNLSYMKADLKDSDDKEFYGANTLIGLGDNIALALEFNKENKSGDTAAAYGIDFTKLGLSAMYKDVEAGAHTAYSAQGGDIHNVSFLNEGYKGMEYKFTKDIVENTAITVTYQDFENQSGDKKEDRTSASLNIKF